MSGRRLPVVDPDLLDRIRPLDQIAAWNRARHGDYDEPRIELLLRLSRRGRTYSLRCDHVVDRDLDPIRLENRTPIAISSGRNEIAQQEEVGHLRRCGEPH